MLKKIFGCKKPAISVKNNILGVKEPNFGGIKILGVKELNLRGSKILGEKELNLRGSNILEEKKPNFGGKKSYPVLKLYSVFISYNCF